MSASSASASSAGLAPDPAEAGPDRLDALLAAGRGRHRAGPWAAALTFGERALLKIKHDPKQLVDSAAIPILFTVLFTYLFGGAVSGSPADYLKVLLPGVLSMSVAVVTVYGGARLAQDASSGAFDRFRGLPVWRGAFVLGALLSDVFRYLFGSAVVIVLGLVMGYRPGGGAPGVLAAVALVTAFGLSLSLVWAVVALLVRDSAVVMGIANAILIPLSFASNIFVPPGTLPGWLRAFVSVNPLSHVATAARTLMSGAAGPGPAAGTSPGAGGAVTWSLVATAVITGVSAPIAFRLYSKQN